MDRGDVSLNGKLVAHYEPCAHTPIPTFPTSGGVSAGPPKFPTPPDGSDGFGASWGNWIEDTYQYPPYGVWNWLTENLYVPPKPTQQTNQTIGYFPGLQSTIQSNCGIIQPVLQWGNSAAGGGAYWAIATWWWGIQNQFHSDLSLDVHVADRLICFDGSVQTYVVTIQDYNTGAQESINAISACEWNLAFPAVLEATVGNPISNCNQLPSDGYTFFSDLQMYYGPWPFNGAYNSVAYAPNPQDRIGTNAPQCPWSITTYPSSGETYLYQ
jgi:hypothetical protein